MYLMVFCLFVLVLGFSWETPHFDTHFNVYLRMPAWFMLEGGVAVHMIFS